MALQTSGQISLNDMHIEVGGSSGSQVSINDTDIRDLIGKSSGAQSSFSEFYGAAAETEVPSGSTINGQSNAKQITASSYISSGETLVIPSGFWVWSDSTSVAALTIDIPCTVKNYGKIIGRGADGVSYTTQSPGQSGGNAIRVTSSGVTITNYSGAYIAGGGGAGGAGGAGGSLDLYKCSGGGAGGGNGGTGQNPIYAQGGTGGVLNASGGDGSGNTGSGGGAGGGGAGVNQGGGAGGRILPGTGGSGGYSNYNGGDGGSAGNNGGNTPDYGCGGGGGWGATGGYGRATYNSDTYYGGSGGAAISKTTSYTLSNSGTIYGST